MKNKDIINQWDNAAKVYSENQRTAPNNLTNWQIIKDIISDFTNKIILDAGCGDGFFSNEMKELGAKVYACDGSRNLIQIAKNDFVDVEFKVCDLTESLPYSDKFFDIVVSSLTLMDIEYLDEFFKETYRILKDDGKLIFTIVHPCFFQAEWEKDSNGKKLWKKIENYWDMNEISLNYWGETTHYHRPITWYTKKLKESGFTIEEIKENPDNIDTFLPIKPHQKRIPLFICFSCLKKINF